MMPSPAAIETIQPSTTSDVCAPPPSAPSAQPSPAVASQASSRCRPTPSRATRTSASATDLSSTIRNGGVSICESALPTAASIVVLRRCRPSLRFAARQANAPITVQRFATRVQVSVLDHARTEATLEPMKRLSRRSFLAASAGMAATPALAQRRQPPPPPVPDGPPRSGYVDAVIVGAGAAGIAAARRLAAAGRRFALVEAAEEVGGRCVTDTKVFGVPYDRGAHWIYAADVNPVARLAPQAGLELYPAPPDQRMRIGRRYAREGEMEDFLATLVRATTAVADAARKSDIASSQVLPNELGDWRPTIEFVLGPHGCGKDLSEVSTVDLARAPERDNSAFCRQGFGAL